MAAKDAHKSGNNNDVIYEVADLWFHSLVLLSHLGEPPSAVTAELERRLGVSGLIEKSIREKINDFGYDKNAKDLHDISKKQIILSHIYSIWSIDSSECIGSEITSLTNWFVTGKAE